MGRGLFSKLNHAKKEWAKVKADPELHKKVIQARIRREKNPDILKERYKKKALYNKELREICKEIGNCPHCFKPRDNPKYKHCDRCREYQRKQKQKEKQ
jgi:hypothetical protein